MNIDALLYPSAIICTLFGLLLLIGIIFSYLWLQFLQGHLTKCPDCNRKGAGDIIDSHIISTVNEMDYRRNPPARVTTKTFEDQYQCQYCQHRWSREGKETRRMTVKL